MRYYRRGWGRTQMIFSFIMKIQSSNTNAHFSTIYYNLHSVQPFFVSYFQYALVCLIYSLIMPCPVLWICSRQFEYSQICISWNNKHFYRKGKKKKRWRPNILYLYHVSIWAPLSLSCLFFFPTPTLSILHIF